MLWLTLISLVVALVLAWIPTTEARPHGSSRRRIDLDHAHGPSSIF